MEKLQTFIALKEKYQNNIDIKKTVSPSSDSKQSPSGRDAAEFVLEINRFESDEMLKGRVGAEFVTLMEEEYEALV